MQCLITEEEYTEYKYLKKEYDQYFERALKVYEYLDKKFPGSVTRNNFNYEFTEKQREILDLPLINKYEINLSHDLKVDFYYLSHEIYSILQILKLSSIKEAVKNRKRC